MKLVRESLIEGVADKAAEMRFGIPDEDREFEKIYQRNLSKKTGKIIGHVFGIDVIKNPNTLINFPNMARGVITETGDLYIVNDVKKLIHIDIIELLEKKGIIEPDSSELDWTDLSEIDSYKFLTVQRVWDKNYMALGESIQLSEIYNKESRDIELSFAIPYLKAAEKKNPKIRFINNGIETVLKTELSNEEYEKLRNFGG
jgi:hypothetical protein